MAIVRTVAAVVSLITGAWGIVSGLYSKEVFGLQPTSGGDFWILAVGVLLLLDSIVCFIGLRTAFIGSAALSILLALDVLLFGIGVTNTGFIISALLVVVTVALDVIAIRHRDLVSEENHPLNLPVFG